MNIATVVSVAGEDAYFKFASLCIPSFLKNCKEADLFVFTDRPREIDKTKSGRLHIINLNSRFRDHQRIVKRLEELSPSDEFFKKRTERYGFLHHHLFVAALLPIAQYYLESEPYTHILKIDIDGYFAGGDLMAILKKDIFLKYPDYDLYLAERKHPLMERYGGGVPGVGFTLWKKSGKFVEQYLSMFKNNEQTTILNIAQRGIVKTKILERPGYHFVRPFWQAQKTGKEFTKEQASEFLPAYFHFHGKDAYRNMKTMENWFDI